MSTSLNAGIKQGIGLGLLRWVARIWSLASLGLLAMFAFGEGGSGPSAIEVVALGFFPIGVALGLIVGWWREGIGGAITVTSLGFFYLWLTVVGGRFPHGPYFLLFAAPGFLYLAGWLVQRMRI